MMSRLLILRRLVCASVVGGGAAGLGVMAGCDRPAAVASAAPTTDGVLKLTISLEPSEAGTPSSNVRVRIQNLSDRDIVLNSLELVVFSLQVIDAAGKPVPSVPVNMMQEPSFYNFSVPARGHKDEILSIGGHFANMTDGVHTVLCDYQVADTPTVRELGLTPCSSRSNAVTYTHVKPK